MCVEEEEEAWIVLLSLSAASLSMSLKLTPHYSPLASLHLHQACPYNVFCFVSSLILSILIYVGFIRSLAVTFSQEQSNIFRHCYCLLSSVFLFFSIHMYHPPFWLILSQCLKMTSEHTFSLCWKSLAAFLSAGGIALGWCRFCLWFLLLHWKLCLRTWGHCGCLYYHHLHKCMLGELDEEICQIPY